MRRLLCSLFLMTGVAFSAPAGESVEQARQAERAGRGMEARELLAGAVRENPSDPQTLLALADFLDRYGDPGAAEAYRKVLDASPSPETARVAALRLTLLAAESGDKAAAREGLKRLQAAGQAGWSDSLLDGAASPSEGFGVAEIPGIFDSFLRMSALSTDLEPGQLLPALARNLVTGGYRTSRGGESQQETEYLKLLKQYLTQARELEQFAGPDEMLDVPACESTETAALLKILGYRLRGECGPDAVLETVNPSRAFLSIDSAFPLAELEDAYRRDAEFHHPYGRTQLPVLFGPEYWIEAADAKGEDFINVFLGDPYLARLYVAMSKMHRPTAIALKEAIPAKELKNFANVLDFFGETYVLRDGKAVVPGSDQVWQKIIETPPSKGVEFLRALTETDDGWTAAYYDAIMRTDGVARTYFTEPQRLERFYDALRGKVTSPGPARPIFRATADLLLLATRLPFDANGKPVIPGGVAVWKELFTQHPHGKYDGKLTKSAQNWTAPDDVLEALFAMSRKVIENEPLKIFLAVSNIERQRSKPLAEATVRRLMLSFPGHGDQFSLFTETPLSDEAIVGYLDAIEKVSKVSRPTRRADSIGNFQALTGLWQILVRQGQIPADRIEPTLVRILQPFLGIDNNQKVFEAGRDGVLALLEASGSQPDASPQDRLIELLAGRPSPGEEVAHAEVSKRLAGLFNSQRLVSLKTLFDLADNLERVSRGESLNVAMANRLAETISEVNLPQAQLSTPESNAFAQGDWVTDHIRDQQKLNLQRSVDGASGNPQQLLEIRGEIAGVLRDSLVGLLYVYYSPPGAELIRSNPLFVRSHDFLGSDQSRSWEVARLQGLGWPSSAGGRLTGSLIGLPYALADSEQNFLIPSERQALIWQDLAPQILIGATVPRWWGVTAGEMHFVGLHVRMGRALAAASAFDAELAAKVFALLGDRVEPSRLWDVEQAFRKGALAEGLEELAPAEVYELAQLMLAREPELADRFGTPFAAEIRELAQREPEKLSYERIAGVFGTPHPALSESYGLELLHLPLFPTMMGYSSRILAESWESTNLYWATLADETHLEPAFLNLRVPQWTQQAIERIFATHLEDWPALLRSMRIVADRQRTQSRAMLDSAMRASR
ncbi:MAG: hypothetical protein GC160_05230 [Acidobacteria bacterium]|nr:hypothetical protein [Acidobacteriota bacterium]